MTYRVSFTGATLRQQSIEERMMHERDLNRGSSFGWGSHQSRSNHVRRQIELIHQQRQRQQEQQLQQQQRQHQPPWRTNSRPAAHSSARNGATPAQISPSTLSPEQPRRSQEGARATFQRQFNEQLPPGVAAAAPITLPSSQSSRPAAAIPPPSSPSPTAPPPPPTPPPPAPTTSASPNATPPSPSPPFSSPLSSSPPSSAPSAPSSPSPSPPPPLHPSPPSPKLQPKAKTLAQEWIASDPLIPNHWMERHRCREKTPEEAWKRAQRRRNLPSPPPAPRLSAQDPPSAPPVPFLDLDDNNSIINDDYNVNINDNDGDDVPPGSELDLSCKCPFKDPIECHKLLSRGWVDREVVERCHCLCVVCIEVDVGGGSSDDDDGVEGGGGEVVAVGSLGWDVWAGGGGEGRGRGRGGGREMWKGMGRMLWEDFEGHGAFKGGSELKPSAEVWEKIWTSE